jgi:flagellar hook-associated protein 3 FlgL
MRISDGMKTTQSVANMRTAQESIQRLQQQISSGRRIDRPSDDPSAAGTILDMRGQLRAAEQYQRNIGQAISRIEAEEAALGQLDDALSRALELAVSQADGLATPETRSQVLAEVQTLMQFAVSLGNTRWGEGFLFGGQQALTQPFDPADPLRARTPDEMALLDQPHRIEISPRQLSATNHNGAEVFLHTGALAALSELAAALESGDGDAVRDSIGSLRAGTARVQDLLGDVGGRYNQFQNTSEALRYASMSAIRLQSELEDLDMAEGMVKLAARQGVLQAAFMSTSQILSMRLTDYLR